MSDIYYCIAAYNEEERLPDCLESLANQRFSGNLETMICLNGCTDNTERAAIKAKQDFPKLNIRVLHSRKGLVYAQNEIVRAATEKSVPMVFVDADVTLDEKCISILKEEMDRVSKLLVVGGWPMPFKPESLTQWEQFLFDILHVRAFYPQAEIATNDIRQFKWYVNEFPQPGVSPEFESRSKIYFHGRIFMLRNACVFELPENPDLADDSYLPNMIHKRHGPGVIRTRFDALAYYKPYISLRNHFNTYRRVFLQKLYLDSNFEQFKSVREMEQSRLDWNYILAQDPKTVTHFIAYSIIRNGEELLFRLLPKVEPSKLWKYDKK